MGNSLLLFFDTKCITNIPQYPEEQLQYNQEETDISILLQAKNVTDLDPFTDLFVSPDTDVLLLLIFITTFNYVQAQLFEQTVATINVISKFIKFMNLLVHYMQRLYLGFTSLQGAIRLFTFMENQN